ncbi:D-alanyl-D-alanine carboxypeptidase/D-alanyl-D-alanine endopeptidase [Nocardioides limicola]|uniref:D-alanyl-D-alanine carboxypeptidase/D-alanyl-D-alanine endopeptidase n=1 Tax=Nocardioides limicola TaxID=2803368 RepID=UPI00193C6E01|nr:D-alanyl-D-alanine carboxypeptidase/D-alanyl-D-alanine-endopeptidase [Nocardioides sp. DJM-14]
MATHDRTGAPHSRATGSAGTVWGPVLLVLAVLGAAVGIWRFELVEYDAAPAAPPAGLELVQAAAPRTLPALTGGGVLAPAKVRRALAEGLRREELGGRVMAVVADLDGGEPLLQRGPGLVTPASTIKLLTAAAALDVLGPDRAFVTRVVTGDRPRDIVLVGGGDPMLTAEADDGSYPGRADLATLATSTALALAEQGRDRVRLGYDASLFGGDGVSRRWREDYVPEGIVARIGALMVDGGRPESGRGRVADPPRAAAEQFAAALTEAGITVIGDPRPQVAPGTADEVAAVTSAPLDQIVRWVLDWSGNEPAEVLAHHVGLALSGEATFATATRGVVDAVRALGVPMVEDEVYDASGLSRANRLSAETLIGVLRLGVDDSRPHLRSLLTGLPVAGFTGTLGSRFVDEAEPGRGWVRAKTGTLTGVHAIAGTAVDADGNHLVFIFAADDVAVVDTLAARAALDDLAADLAGCSCSR